MTDEPTEDVKHTGAFGSSIAASEIALARVPADYDWDHQTRGEFLDRIWKAIGDGRRYVAHANMAELRHDGVVEHNYRATIVLLDPAQARAGEYVLRRDGDQHPSLRPDVPLSTWKLTQHYWIRES